MKKYKRIYLEPIEDELSVLCQYKHGEWKINLNKMLIPITLCRTCKEGMNEFNKIYAAVKSIITKRNLKQLVLTKSGGISIARKNFSGSGYLIINNGDIELILIIPEGIWRIQFRNLTKEQTELMKDTSLSGTNAFLLFKGICMQNGIDLDKYKIKNGPEIKKTIEKYIIKKGEDCFGMGDMLVTHINVHHIDFHSSFASGLALTHPEFRPIIEKIYKERKQKPENKAILNYTIGKMQSLKGGNASWAHLSRDAIKNNNDRIRELSKRLRESGRRILLYNTDGIWYTGDIYHGEGEGPGIGEWSNDHINCNLRIKSPGSYEYIENGKYYPVLRGSTKLDKIKPRENWEWGDIFNIHASEVIKYKFDEENGITEIMEDMYYGI